MIVRLVVSAALLLAALAVSAPAQAQYPVSCEVTLGSTTVPAGPGTSVQIIGADFEPGTTATFFINGELLGTAAVAADGTVNATFEIPAAFEADGVYTITVDCLGNDTVVSVVLTVGRGNTTTTVAPPTSPTSPSTTLPVTGASSTTILLAQFAAALVGVGAIIVVVARRRRRDRLPA